ncbi:MAG TPA: SCP2 sterol-binding domain-containing protein, partial [Acidimicrobiales bacterium]|nr:SCP2 sterol-binding domain-containing protein [Acidimicrobiales bacterium]
MATILTQAWLDEQREAAAGLPARPGVSARLQHVVTGAPGGEARYVTVIEDGRITEAALGDDPDADLVLTQSFADAERLASGELDLSAAFMQGRVKVVGDIGTFLALQPLL